MKGKPFGIKPTVPARSREQAETTISMMKKARDKGHFIRMVRDKLYIDNNLHTPRREVAEGTNVKEFAVEDQPCTPQNSLRIQKPVNVHGSVLPQIAIIRKT